MDTDEEIRQQVRQLLSLSFARLNLHTHAGSNGGGDNTHARLIAGAQNHVAEAMQDLRELDRLHGTLTYP